MNESDAKQNPVEPRAIERRTVLKIAAWATPAITLMSATPAFATSPPRAPLLVSVALSATRHTGNPNAGKTVNFVWSLQANTAVTITSISFSADRFTIGPRAQQQTILAGQTAEIIFTGENQSANELNIPAIAITVTLSDNSTATFATVGAHAEQGVSTTLTVTAASSNPTV